MLRILFSLLLLCSFLPAQIREKETPEMREKQVRQVLEKFNAAMEQRDIDGVAAAVASDLTVFGGGEVLQSWIDYRDNVLYKTFSKPAPTSTWEIVKVDTAAEMAWAYTKTTLQVRREGVQTEVNVYTTYILEKRAPEIVNAGSTGASDNKPARSTASKAPEEWKIVLIEQAGQRPQQPRPNATNSGNPGPSQQ